MAVKTKKEKKTETTAPETAATIGVGNPGIASSFKSMNALLSKANVVAKVAETPGKKSTLPLVELDHSVEVSIPGELEQIRAKVQQVRSLLEPQKTKKSGDIDAAIAVINIEIDKLAEMLKGQTGKRNVIDLWLESIHHITDTEAKKKEHAGTALPLAEKLRVNKSRADNKHYANICVRHSGDPVEPVAYYSSTYAVVKPHKMATGEELTKEKMVAALEAQFGQEWERYVAAESKLVLSRDLDVPKLMQVIKALEQHGLQFGNLVSEEVEFKPTELLRQEETLKPEFAEKVTKLAEAEVVKKNANYLKRE